MISFEHPWWLLALALLPVAWLQWWRCATLPADKRRRMAVTRTLLMLVLILVLAGLGLRVRQPGTDIIVLLDVSDSVLAGDREQAIRRLDAIEEQLRPADRLAVVIFAGAAEIMKPWERQRADGIPRFPDGSATNIEKALQTAANLAAGGRNTRILLLSDGRETEGEAALALPLLVRQNIVVDTVPIAPAVRNEVLVETVSAPQHVQQGEPFFIRAVVTSTHDTEGTVYLFRNNAFVEAREVTLHAGRNLIVFSELSQEAGIAEYEVRIEADADAFLANNAARTLTVSRSPARVLLVAGDLNESRILEEALSLQGIEVQTVTAGPGAFSRSTLTEAAAVVLHNVSAVQLSPGQLADLEHYVGQTGGGLVIIGGTSSYGLGGYAGTQLEALAPVYVEGPEHLLLPSLAMVLVLDKSGSMAQSVGAGSVTKLDLAKEASVGVLQFMDRRDLFGLVAFDSRPHWTVPLQPLEHKDWTSAQILRLVPDGGTNVFPALELAFEALRDVQAAVKHVIVLSDGHTVEADFASLVTRMAAAGITVSTVAVGEADRDLLRLIAEIGRGRYYFADDPYRIPYIFASETRIVSPPQYVERTSSTLVLDDRDFLGGLPAPWPPVDGYATTYPKDSATVHLAADTDMPLLASWRYRLGRVVAFTSGLGGWSEWPGFAPFWAQTVRWAMRPAATAHVQTGFDIRRGVANLWIDVLDEAGDYLNFLPLTAMVRRPDGTDTSIPLKQTGPGRYEATFPAPAAGDWSATIASTDLRLPEPLSVTTSVPYAEEYGTLMTNRPLLATLAETTGGRLLDSLDQLPEVLASTTGSQSPVSLWRWCVLLAIVLFMLDLTWRYVPDETWAEGRLRIKAAIRAIAGTRKRQAHRLLHSVVTARKKETEPPPSDSRQRASRAAHTYLALRKKKRQAAQQKPAEPAD